MSVWRDRARAYMNRIPPSGLGSLDNQKEFDAILGPGPLKKDELTGQLKPIYDSRQAQMEASGWQMTMCNEFAGEFARSVLGVYLGALNLKANIQSGSRAYAWVDSNVGDEPHYGDIFYCEKPHQHLGVACSVFGGRLYKVEAGQGGVNYGQDFLKWTDSPWNPSDYVGWLDIDQFMGGPKGDSLIGKWTVWGDKRRYRWTYTFTEKNVTWMDVFNGMFGSGTWTTDNKNLTIHWYSGSKDVWTMPINEDGMTGYEDMKGEGRMDIQASKQNA